MVDGAWTYPQGVAANWSYMPAHGHHRRVNFGQNDGSAITVTVPPGLQDYNDARVKQVFRTTWGVLE
jgi:hypothetical protein